jgi:two-component system chemotaxis sensor kinase CheA
MDMNQYLDIFVEESREHLQQLNSSILEFEKDNQNKAVLNEIFRVAHTLKGMAGTMGYTKMQTLTHHMEDVLDALRNEHISADSSMVDVLFSCLDALETYVNNIVATGQEGNEAFQEVVNSLSNILGKEEKSNTAQKSAEPVSGKTEAKSGPVANLRVELNKYDINVIKKAVESNMNVFEIHVSFDRGCLLKAARAFIVFQILDKNSDIIKSEPKVEDIEDEKFDFEFTVVVITKKPEEFFIKEINSIAEISGVEVAAISSENIGENMASSEAACASQESLDKIKTAEQAQQQFVQDEQNLKKAHKAGKTVRVDIDRLDVLMNLVSELIIIKNSLGEKNRGGNARENDSIE